MSERRSGHVINISSMGVIGPPARFSAYVASKSALEGWTRCAEVEYANRKVHFTNINMPLVRTPMIGPTKVYDYAPALTPEEAAEMVVDAVIHKQSRVTTDMGRFQQVWNVLSPKSYASAMNGIFRMFDEPAPPRPAAALPGAAAGEAPSQPASEPSSEQVALATLMKGMHY